MKKLLTTLFLLSFYFSAICQSSDAFRNKMNDIFQHVDLNQVPNHLLLDYGAEMTRMSNWEGVITADNIGSMGMLRQVYGSVFSMQTTTGLGLTSLATINQRLDSYINDNEVVLAATHMDYYQIKPGALLFNLMSISNGKLYDTPGRPVSPYQRKHAVAFASLRYRYETSNSVPFKLPSNLFIRNTAETIENIQIDFGNGQGYQTVSLNSIKNVTYSQSGEYTLKIRIRYTNGQNYFAQTKIFVSVISLPLALSSTQTPTLYDGIADVSPSITGTPYQGIASSGRVSVEYGADDNNARTLDKPFIVSEGFDINAIISGDPTRDFDYRDFINNPETGGINAEIEPNVTLRQALFARGYDIVFLNYDDVTAPIQRNAYLLEKVIEWVNDNKDNDAEQNVVMGQSMGGPVVRYALRHMEQTGRTHDTRLYVSFDGPHQGANIPLAMQAGVHHLVNAELKYGIVSIPLKNLFPQVQYLYDGLNAPAAQQMLIYSLNGTGTNISLNSTAHDAFYNELRTMGMPSQGGIRNISIANGSECGTDQGFDPYDVSIQLSEELDINYFLGLVSSIITYNPVKQLASFFATNTDVKSNFVFRMLPDHESQTIYSGSIQLKKKILFLINTTQDLIPQLSFSTPSNILPYDNAGGGVRDFSSDLEDLIPQDLESSFKILHFNFLPTHSTLDIGSGNVPITNTQVYGAYSAISPPTGSQSSSFDNFYTNADDNEVHLNVNPGNGQFLIAELDGGSPTCYSSCGLENANITTTGPSVICNSGQGTYIINNVPTGVQVNWTTSTNLSIVSGQGTAALVVQAPSTGNQSGWVQATMQNECEEVSAAPRSITLGPATAPPGFIQGESNPYQGQIETYTISAGGGYGSYDWSVPFGVCPPNSGSCWQIISGGDGYGYVQVIVGSTDGYVQVRKNNQCGFGAAKVMYVTVNSGGGSCPTCPQPIVSPNPSTQNISISYKQEANDYKLMDTPSFDHTIDYQLMHTSGEPVKQKRSKKTSETIDLNNVKDGVYLLQIIHEGVGTQTIKVKVQKE